MSRKPLTLVWFGNDLRLSDHAPLVAAARRGAVIPVYVHAPEDEGDHGPGAAHRWWLHHSLGAFADDLERVGSKLVIRRGAGVDTIVALAEETGADAVYWHRRYEPALAAVRDRARAQLEARGIEVEAFDGWLLHDTEGVRTTQGNPYTVFTPFYRNIRKTMEVDKPLSKPRLKSKAPASWPASMSVADLELLPSVRWDAGLGDTWVPGERGAWARLNHFADERLRTYSTGRDRPDRDGTSMLSPWLRFGEISARQAWIEIDNRAKRARSVGLPENAEDWHRELIWREFAWHVLVHNPDTPTKALRPKWDAFPWEDNADDEWLEAWKRGRTGFPIVDAGMRQLWNTGWMHNRVRMVVASFLTKDLLLHWRLGERFFWDTLVDADLGNNVLGWQWAAGSGADAQPFFRIFNPVSQGEKFDPEGDYVRRWCPELARMPRKFIHRPWEAPSEVLEQAGVTLGEDYPEPIVDHSEARERALELYHEMR